MVDFVAEVVGFADVEAEDDADEDDDDDDDGAVEAVDEPVDEAGACGLLWKSVQVSVRKVSPPAVTLNAVGVTVYFTPSLSTTKASPEVCLAAAISLAPSETRTPRYS